LGSRVLRRQIGSAIHLKTRLWLFVNIFKRGYIPASAGETKMTQLMSSVKNFLVSEDGPTAVEYAIMLALIVIVCIGAVQSIGSNAATKFNAAGAAL
jgi:pilus assembly protein Flp/PilA